MLSASNVAVIATTTTRRFLTNQIESTLREQNRVPRHFIFSGDEIARTKHKLLLSSINGKYRTYQEQQDVIRLWKERKALTSAAEQEAKLRYRSKLIEDYEGDRYTEDDNGYDQTAQEAFIAGAQWLAERTGK